MARGRLGPAPAALLAGILALAACGETASPSGPVTASTSPSSSPGSSPGDSPAASPSAGSPAPRPSTVIQAASVCRDPSDHVYHPYRLEVRNPCMTVSGVVVRAISEADGDLHVRLRLDPQYANLINAMNESDQAGDLILEPVCERPVTQADAVSTCQGYTNPVVVPPAGTHVVAIGAYVLDADHGWMELHPLWAIRPA